MRPPVSTTKSAKIWRRVLVALFLMLAVCASIRARDATGWRQALCVITGALWLWWAIAGIVRISRESEEDA